MCVKKNIKLDSFQNFCCGKFSLLLVKYNNDGICFWRDDDECESHPQICKIATEELTKFFRTNRETSALNDELSEVLGFYVRKEN